MKTFAATRLFHPLDVRFADFMTRVTHSLPDSNTDALFLAAAMVSRATREGNICLDLNGTAGKTIGKDGDDAARIKCPPLEEWCESLGKSSVVGIPGKVTPLVLDDRGRLYLYRYWEYQEKLAGDLARRSGEMTDDIDTDLLRRGLERLFPSDASTGVDWQNVAAFNSVTRNFCVISGGPGTGKTTVVARVLALLAEQARPETLRIALIAPTGKAAARLKETIEKAIATLDCPDNVRNAIPRDTSTIHRLLGSIRNSPYFRHDAGNPLSVDTVIVDEASMVDLALMSKLVQALPPDSRLILVGDMNQLSSVESGAVLGDICDTGTPRCYSHAFRNSIERTTGYRIPKRDHTEPQFGEVAVTEPVKRGSPHQEKPGFETPPGGFIDSSPESMHGGSMADCIVELRKNYRFDERSGIGAVSRAVNEGDAAQAEAILADRRFGDIAWREFPGPEMLRRALAGSIVDWFEGYMKAGAPGESLERFERFRILCALREGPWGVSALNSLVLRILVEKRLVPRERELYAGLPVLIARNDYNMRLFNGDVGIILPDPAVDGHPRAFFPATDGSIRSLHPARLPEWETVYAMTVHKSQGSEFDRVILVLPDRDYPVLSRELLYTGITRARTQVEIWGTAGVFRTAVSRRTRRSSGLRDALWGMSPP